MHGIELYEAALLIVLAAIVLCIRIHLAIKFVNSKPLFEETPPETPKSASQP
jgi:hypothetical protein